MIINVVDIESTCWDGPPPPGMQSEPIQIGIAVLDLSSLQIVTPASFPGSVLIRPERSRVSPFCTSLTGLEAAQVEAAGSFQDAVDELQRLGFEVNTRPWLSWGAYDRRMLQAAHPEAFHGPHLDFKRQLARALNQKPRGMPGGLQAMGLEPLGRHHDGGDDALNIARIAQEAARRGMLRPGDWQGA